jgi:hypothetical protein
LPTDTPLRYQPVGFFRGSGGVSFDPETKNVTVIDRDNFERSQLALRSIYALHVDPKTQIPSYWETREPLLADEQDFPVLAEPIVSTIDFYAAPPTNIFNTAFPEKIVLAFYASTCGEADETLCRTAGVGWDTSQFLVGEARIELANDTVGYFGLSSFVDSQNILVKKLAYYPSLETDPDLLETGTARDTLAGEEPLRNIVEITFSVNGSPFEDARFKMESANGQWKIARRVPLDSLVLENPVEIPASQ